MYNGLLLCCKCHSQRLCPFKTDHGAGAKGGIERHHYVVKLGIVSNLVHDAEPTGNICGRGWCRKILDSIEILRQRLNGFIRNAESRGSTFLRAKLNLSVCVEDYLRAAHPYREISHVFRCATMSVS